MSGRSRSFFLATLVPAVLLGGVFAVVQAQNAAPGASRWSDPATWPNRKVPAAGDKVIIGKDKNVVLDVSPPALGGLSIDGKLSFSNDADLELQTEWIMLHGELQIGTEARPHTRKATITFTDNVKNEDVMAGMGDRGIMISGGTLNLHGNTTNTWTKLAKTATAGATSIEVLNAQGWKVGDEIVLASTDYDPRQAERRTVTAVNGNTLTLDKKLDYMHFGKITFDVDQRGEVGLLSRNIKIQASEDAAQTFFGGHIMAMPSSKVYVSGIELNRMGQHMVLARYPIHWHLVGDAKGQYIKNAAIHDTFSRCVTIHGTHNLRVENNVTYNTVGHCFFLEDGIETGNEFIKNLAMQTKCHPTKKCMPTNLQANGEADHEYESRNEYRRVSWSGKETLLPSDNTVASYWITNPDNVFIGNVAAGSDENGFWLSLPEHPNGQFLDTEISKNTWPRRTKLREFRDNVAHSNFDGFMFDRNINVDNTFGLAGNAYNPKENPADANSKTLETHFENLTTYKNRNGGFWGRGELFIVNNLKTADNAIGFTMSSGNFGREAFTSVVRNSLFVGETENIGNPQTPEEKAAGRSLPKRKIPDFPVRGYEYYDYRVDVENTTFVNYQDSKTRKAGALSWLLFTSSGVSTENTIKGAKYVNAKPVYFPNIDTRFDNDNRGGGAWQRLAIHDLDGTTTGLGGDSFVLLYDGENNSVAADSTCKVQKTWNAVLCKGDVGAVNFGGAGGGGGFGGGRGAGGAPGAGGPGAPRAGGAGPGAPAAAGAARAPGSDPTSGPSIGGPVAGAAGAAAGAAAPARGGAFGGAFGGGGTPQPPIVLTRGKEEIKLRGNGATIKSGTEVTVKTERPEFSISLSEMELGSWVVFQLPGYTKAEAKQADSLAALRKAAETSFFKDKDSLWVKVVVATPPSVPAMPLQQQASVRITK
ncbi:MAG TPA: G8 domain-containing protein [Steroidobacteraceae bacterium]|nr:G8 domain-containing protein [Steroidobacteraceae bacterium]